MIRLRQWQDSRRLTPLSERLAMKAWAWTLASPARYRAASAAARWLMNTAADSTDAAGRRWLSALPGPLAGWTARRNFPAPAPHSFRHWWASRKGPPS